MPKAKKGSQSLHHWQTWIQVQSKRFYIQTALADSGGKSVLVDPELYYQRGKGGSKLKKVPIETLAVEVRKQLADSFMALALKQEKAQAKERRS